VLAESITALVEAFNAAVDQSLKSGAFEPDRYQGMQDSITT